MTLLERLHDMGDRTNRHNYSIGHYWNVVEEAEEEIESLKSRLAIYEEALKKYGSHFNSCSGYCGDPLPMRWSRFDEEKCDCGLKEALSQSPRP